MGLGPMPPRLTEVGSRERPDHYYLPVGARCYFWGEYTPYEHTSGKKWNFSPTNHLLSNLKKKTERRGQSDWQYKVQAIQTIGVAFARFFKWGELQSQHRVALIPVPPSKPRGSPEFDPRMLLVLNKIAETTRLSLDIRDCLSLSGKYAASHTTLDRPSPDELYDELSFDAEAGRSDQQPDVIFLFDDMLTTGAHYVAMTRMLSSHFPGVQVIGNFVARRIVPSPFADTSGFDLF